MVTCNMICDKQKHEKIIDQFDKLYQTITRIKISRLLCDNQVMHEKHYEHVLEMQEFYTLRIENERFRNCGLLSFKFHRTIMKNDSIVK